MNCPYYVPSGRLPAGAVLLALLYLPVVAAPAWLYAWLMIHSPFILLDLFALAAFAIVMGMFASGAARRGKARNPRWMGRLGLVIGFAGWYAHWAALLAIVDAGSFAALLASPRAMFGYAMAVSETGTHSIAGIPIKGGVLIACWLVELFLLTGLPRSLARAAADEPFCEQTDSWASSFTLPRKFAYIEMPDIAVHRLETDAHELFSILEPCTHQDPARYSAVRLHRTAGDPFISIDNVRVERSAKKEKHSARPVIAYLRLPGVHAEQVIEYGICGAADALALSDPAPV